MCVQAQATSAARALEQEVEAEVAASHARGLEAIERDARKEEAAHVVRVRGLRGCWGGGGGGWVGVGVGTLCKSGGCSGGGGLGVGTLCGD